MPNDEEQEVADYINGQVDDEGRPLNPPYNPKPVRSTELFCMECVRPGDGFKYFWAFYAHPRGVRCHDKNAEVLKVRVYEDLSGGSLESYYGWWDLDYPGTCGPCFSLVYYRKLMLGMCFPYGVDAEEKQGRGLCLPVKIEVLERGIK